MDSEADGQVMYKLRPKSVWYIGPAVTSHALKNTNKALDTPPMLGWQYMDLDGWHYDYNFKMDRLSNASICLTVKIRKGLLGIKQDLVKLNISL